MKSTEKLEMPPEIAVLVEGRSEEDVKGFRDWVFRAKGAGITRDAIVRTLVGSGWPEPFVEWHVDASSAFAGEGLAPNLPASPGIGQTPSGALVEIPAGEFTMGSTENSHEGPLRKVFLDAYRIGKNPVTVAEFRSFCEAVGFSYDWKKYRPSWGWLDNHPMVCVNWSEARGFCQWAGGDLPTEAQWEKAARGQDGRTYPWGDAWDSGRCRHSTKDWGDAVSTSQIGKIPNGASPYGCLDMAGNVWEWCLDWYEPGYSPQIVRNPSGPSGGQKRVLRGGAWSYTQPGFFRCAARYDGAPALHFHNYGFRVAAKI